MQLFAWSVATSIDHAIFEHGIFARSQQPYNTAADVLKRVI